MLTCETSDLVAYGKVDGTNMAVTITSNSILVERLFSLAFQPVYTGAPVGTFFIDYSLDNVNWNAMGSQAISVSGSWYLDITNPVMTSKWARLRYVPTSGTGVLKSLMMTAKG